MNDDMSIWLPVAEHLKNISLSGLYTFKDIIEAEIALRQNAFENAVHMRQESFYNDLSEKKSVKLEVVK